MFREDLCYIDLAPHTYRISGDNRSHLYLFQHLSVAIQRGNVASVLGTIGSSLTEDVLEV